MGIGPNRRGVRPLAVAAWLVLLAAAIVFSTSFAVDYPDPVPPAACLVALVALLTVAISTWRTSRSTGASWYSALWRSTKAVGQFMLGFF